MRSADHVHITTRRAMLAGLAAAPVMQITPSASAATAPHPAPASSGPSLLDVWRERCRCVTERSKFDEFKQPDEFWAWENRRLELEETIIQTKGSSVNDLLGKLEMSRFYAGPSGPGMDDELALSIAELGETLVAKA